MGDDWGARGLEIDNHILPQGWKLAMPPRLARVARAALLEQAELTSYGRRMLADALGV